MVPNWCVVSKFQERRERVFTSFHFHGEKSKILSFMQFNFGSTDIARVEAGMITS